MNSMALMAAGAAGALTLTHTYSAYASVGALPAAVGYSTTIASYYDIPSAMQVAETYSSTSVEGAISASTIPASSTAGISASSPFVQASATAMADSTNASSAYAIALNALVYDFTVVSPFPDPVPVDINYELDATRSGTNLGSSSATISIYDSVQNLQSTDQIQYVSGEGGSGSKVDINSFSINESAGQVYIVNLLNYVDAQAGSFTTAYADPRISIDPAYLATHPGVSLLISPGVGNSGGGVSAVPEPRAWALMIAGLGMVAATLRYGRRHERTPAAV